jgi:hypothetical protein
LRQRVPNDWDSVMLLCDYAEEVGGKLYVMGGGWSHLRTPNQPSNMALAIQISVPWNQANEPHDLTIRLVTGDGHPVQNEQGENIELTGKVEVGRPPGLRPGSQLAVPLAARFNGLILEPGTYRWELEVDGAPLEDTTFDVIQPG